MAGSIKGASITTDMFNYSFEPPAAVKLKLFYDFGFRYIHWCDDWREEDLYTRQRMEQNRKLIEESGLKCLDVHSAETASICICAETDENLERYIHLLENRIEFCSVVGGDTVVVHPPSPEKGSRTLSWKVDRSCQVFESLEPLCEKLGVGLAVENCYPTDEKILDRYFRKYPSSFIGFCLDSGHANVNRNLSEMLRFGDRMKAIHLHDNKGATDDHQPPFWGTIDWNNLMRWVRQSGYSKPINFEITHRPSLFEGPMVEYLDFAARSIRKAMAVVRT